MLRKFLDWQLSLSKKGKPLHFLEPLIEAGDTFLYESAEQTKTGPHIRDAIDIKRIMSLVVFALIPCIVFGIWNAGIQSYVYSSGNYKLMQEFLSSARSLEGYFSFAAKDSRWMDIFKEGLYLVVPIIFISYLVGGLWEVLFSLVRRHPISEGFLVTGILYALIMPPTIPLWMLAIGISAGIIFSKEVFGGSGMNIVNPALAARCFLFFGFPGRMSGSVWVGANTRKVSESLLHMNTDLGLEGPDAFTQATKLAQFNISPEIKKIHIDAIASNDFSQLSTYTTLQEQFTKFRQTSGIEETLGKLSADNLKAFITAPLDQGGLGLSSGAWDDAYRFSALNFGFGDGNDPLSFFLGNKLGSIGETSGLAILIGALILILTKVGSWRTMLGMLLGAFATASLFQWGSTLLTADGGAWVSAQFTFPAYKHLLLGGLAFGAVFMATDPVSSADTPLAKWIYGGFCGMVAIVIRVLNPAFPEGVMLAILMGNVFAPLFDYYVAKMYRNRRLARARKATAN